MEHEKEIREIFSGQWPHGSNVGSLLSWKNLIEYTKSDFHAPIGCFRHISINTQAKVLYKILNKYFLSSAIFSCLAENETKIVVKAFSMLVGNPLESYKTLLRHKLLHRKHENQIVTIGINVPADLSVLDNNEPETPPKNHQGPMDPQDAEFLKVLAGATFTKGITMPSGAYYNGDEITALASYYEN